MGAEDQVVTDVDLTLEEPSAEEREELRLTELEMVKLAEARLRHDIHAMRRDMAVKDAKLLELAGKNAVLEAQNKELLMRPAIEKLGKDSREAEEARRKTEKELGEMQQAIASRLGIDGRYSYDPATGRVRMNPA